MTSSTKGRSRRRIRGKGRYSGGAVGNIEPICSTINSRPASVGSTARSTSGTPASSKAFVSACPASPAPPSTTCTPYSVTIGINRIASSEYRHPASSKISPSTKPSSFASCSSLIDTSTERLGTVALSAASSFSRRSGVSMSARVRVLLRRVFNCFSNRPLTSNSSATLRCDAARSFPSRCALVVALVAVVCAASILRSDSAAAASDIMPWINASAATSRPPKIITLSTRRPGSPLRDLRYKSSAARPAINNPPPLTKMDNRDIEVNRVIKRIVEVALIVAIVVTLTAVYVRICDPMAESNSEGNSGKTN